MVVQDRHVMDVRKALVPTFRTFFLLPKFVGGNGG